MADPFDVLIGAGVGGPTIGLLVWAVQKLGARSVTALDKQLEHLEGSIEKQGNETKSLIGDLSREMRFLRDTDIAQAKDIGALQKGLENIEKRVDGQSGHYKAELEAHRKAIFDRLTETVDAVTSKKGKGR